MILDEIERLDKEVSEKILLYAMDVLGNTISCEEIDNDNAKRVKTITSSDNEEKISEGCTVSRRRTVFYPDVEFVLVERSGITYIMTRTPEEYERIKSQIDNLTA